jgi:predicted MPP superfamily phosphohydrolase
LPAAFDGYCVAHLTDLHIGEFDPLGRGLHWADRANAAQPDLCVVTGDFVTSGTGFYTHAARVVGRLRAPDGVFACMGNHDQTDNDSLTALLEERGTVVLRNQWRSIRRGEAELVVAGLDDRYRGEPDLDATLAGRPSGVPTVLLSHDPYVGEDAARRGVQLVLSGHTHGGQIGIPWIGDRANLTLVMRQPRSGLHRMGDTQHYISSGLGTTGPPLRLGVPPEIVLLVLRSRAGNMAAS